MFSSRGRYGEMVLEFKSVEGGHVVRLVDYRSLYGDRLISGKVRKGSSRVEVENGNIVRKRIGRDDVESVEVLTKTWSDWVDYWSVDFDYDGVFTSNWESFRDRRHKDIETESIAGVLGAHIAVMTVDILGCTVVKILDIGELEFILGG